MSVVEAGIQVSAATADPCPLCSSDASHESHRTPVAVDRRDELLLWAVGLTTAVVIASVGIGSDRLFGIGALAGLLAGTGLAWRSVRTAVRAREAAHDRTVRALNDDADGRVAMVIRQFEWAVNDVAKLKREDERAQVTADLLIVQGRARERHVRRLERQILQARQRAASAAATTPSSPRAEFDPGVADAASALRFGWGLHHDGDVTRLELECDARARATRVRIVDRTGGVTARSLNAMHSGDGSLCFALADLPADLIADLDAGRESAYRLQVLCDYEWRPALLEDTGRRTKLVTDKQGRLFRVTDAPTAAQPVAPVHNPFDYNFDSSFVTL